MNDNFSFTYSLKERQEIEDIRKKYIVDDTDSKTKSPADKIKHIDKNVETTATIISPGIRRCPLWASRPCRINSCTGISCTAPGSY